MLLLILSSVLCVVAYRDVQDYSSSLVSYAKCDTKEPFILVLKHEACANDVLLGKNEIAINMINVIGRAIKVLGPSVVPLILV